MGFNLDAYLTVPEHDALNHAGLPGVGGGGGGTIFSVSEVSHGFEPGQPIYFDGATSGWNLASANDDATTADALVFAVTDVDNFDYILAGELELTVGEWDMVVGATENGLVTGEHYRLSITTGRLSLNKSTGEITQFVMRALSVTKALVYLGEPHAGLGSGGVSEISQTVVRRTTTHVLPMSLAGNISWDTLDVETNSAEIEHDFGGNGTDRIYVHNDGLHNVQLTLSAANTAGASPGTFQLRINDSVVVPGGTKTCLPANNVDYIIEITTTVLLSAGDYISYRGEGTGSTITVQADATLKVWKNKAAGGGFGVNIENANAPLPGGPFGTLNLLNTSAVDAGNGVADLLVDTKPTPTNWGSNRQILSAVLTLVDNSPTVHYLEASVGIIAGYGQDRPVRLPPPSLLNPYFIIHHTGVGEGNIVIEDTLVGLSHEVHPGEAARAWTDGTVWFIEDMGWVESDENRLSWYQYGGINNANDEFFTAMGQALDTLNTGTGQSNTTHVMTRSGTIEFLQYAWSAGLGDVTIHVRVNDISRGFHSFVGVKPYTGSVRLNKPITVAAGDRVMVRNSSGATNPGAGTIALGILNRGGPIYCFAGDPGGGGDYFRALERADINLTAGFNNDREHVFFFPSSDIVMSWATQSGSGSTFTIHKNTVLFDTVIPGANSGFQALTGSFLASDRISIQWTGAGGDPGDCTINFDAGGQQAECHYWGGSPNGGGVYYPANHPIPVVFGSTTPGADHRHTAHRSGRIVMTWRGGGAGANGMQLVSVDDFDANITVIETFGDLSLPVGRAVLTARAVAGKSYAVRTETGAGGETIGMAIY